MTDIIKLTSDPYNLVITGVGGQGNVLASRILGNMLVDKGLHVTVGETFGVSQRGGSVFSQIRISARPGLSPQIPEGMAHMIIALEPVEVIRIMTTLGNPAVKVICNTRPVYPVEVIAGTLAYPELEDLKEKVRSLSAKSWFVDATNKAHKMGAAILGNVILIGALAGTGELPLERDGFEQYITKSMSADKLAMNLTAFDLGVAMVS